MLHCVHHMLCLLCSASWAIEPATRPQNASCSTGFPADCRRRRLARIYVRISEYATLKGSQMMGWRVPHKLPGTATSSLGSITPWPAPDS